MAAKRREYYFGSDRDGNNLLYEGICAEARVVSVIRAGIFVDLFGLEVYIPLRELSYQRMLDASSAFQPGQRILVKILSIDRSDRAHPKVSASIKQAGENPYEKALRRYTVGNRYVGTVSMVDMNGVFVALDGGIDCLCSYPKRGRPPQRRARDRADPRHQQRLEPNLGRHHAYRHAQINFSMTHRQRRHELEHLHSQ